MQGQRILNGFEGLPPRGAYWKDSRGVWMACTPDGHLGDLSNHDVTEHEDGTISVSPSILVSAGRGKESWHGYLERGVWREC
jgi:hypothetical protein